MSNITIEGEYVLNKNEGFYEHLVAQGIAEEKAKAADLVKPIMTISVENEDITFVTDLGSARVSSTLKINQEVEERIGLDMTVKSYTEVDGNRVTIQSIGPKGEVGQRDFEFSETDMIMKNRTGSSKALEDKEEEAEKENPLRRYRKRPYTGTVTNKAWCEVADYKKLVAKTKIEKLRKDMELTDVLIEQNKLKNKLLQLEIDALNK